MDTVQVKVKVIVEHPLVEKLYYDNLLKIIIQLYIYKIS